MYSSHQSKQFRKLFAALPDDAKRQARAAFKLFQENPHHSSLNFKPVLTAGVNAWSAMIGDHYRVIGYMTGNEIDWWWIGSHEAYNKIVKQRR